VPYRRGTTERDVVALGTHAVAVSPPELVEAVRSALLAVVRAHAEGAQPGATTTQRSEAPA
jgi:proteasome accessory factor B